MRQATIALAATLAALVVTAGPARAQSCAAEQDGATRCRLTLSAPRAFTVQANARLIGRPAHPPRMIILVNGQPCRTSRYTRWGVTWGECRVVFPSTASMVEASVEGEGVRTQGVGVVLIPDDRLAELPREDRDLYPKRKPNRFWPPALPHVWPFAH